MNTVYIFGIGLAFMYACISRCLKYLEITRAVVTPEQYAELKQEFAILTEKHTKLSIKYMDLCDRQQTGPVEFEPEDDDV